MLIRRSSSVYQQHKCCDRKLERTRSHLRKAIFSQTKISKFDLIKEVIMRCYFAALITAVAYGTAT